MGARVRADDHAQTQRAGCRQRPDQLEDMALGAGDRRAEGARVDCHRQLRVGSPRRFQSAREHARSRDQGLVGRAQLAGRRLRRRPVEIGVALSQLHGLLLGRVARGRQASNHDIVGCDVGKTGEQATLRQIDLQRPAQR